MSDWNPQIDHNDYLEILGFKCCKTLSTSLYGEKSFWYLTVQEDRLNGAYVSYNVYAQSIHCVTLWGPHGQTLAGGQGKTLQEATENARKEFKETIDRINLIKGRIL